MTDAVQRAHRELLARLELPPELATAQTPARPLTGRFLGRFLQPALALRSVGAMQVELETTEGVLRGKGTDPYGELSVEGTADGHEVQFVKRYAKGAQVDYRGVIVGSAVLGTWHHRKHPDFCGVFALVGAEALSEPLRSELARQAHAKSEGRSRLVAPLGIAVALLVATALGWLHLLVLPLVFAAYTGVLLFRKREVQELVERWCRALGRPGPS